MTIDVAIVGYGPVGAVAAALLASYGLSVAIFDKGHEVYAKPRAFALDHEIMRVFQQLDLAEQVLEFAEPFTPSNFLGVSGDLIKSFASAEPPYPYAFPPALVFNQPAVERVLRKHIAALPNVHVFLDHTLLSYEQLADRVVLNVQGQEKGKFDLQSYTARYLIGCDGASSTVRPLADIALEDLGFDQPWLVVDVLANAHGLAKLPKTSLQICEPQRPTTFLIGTKNHRRWEIALNDDEQPEQMIKDDIVWGLLARWIEPTDAQLWRCAAYRFHALVAQHWRIGNVFIAGDAAHQQPPFLGQGMCQGIRDVVNLSWKLKTVISDQTLTAEATNRLLDSYETERKAHVTELTTRIKGIGQLVGERDLAKAQARDARLIAEAGGQVRPQPRQSVQPTLTNGLLSNQTHAAVGTLIPQPWVLRGDDRVRLDQLIDYGWRLISIQPIAKKLPDSIELIVMSVNEFVEEEGVLAAWFEQQACNAALVRPDHYVWGVVTNEQSLNALVLEWQQQLERDN